MKKKFGFTLAEMLITLGIIGVVAALTAPSLVNNSGQAKVGPSLAKFVNTWETAAEQLEHENEVNNLLSVTNDASWGMGSSLLEEMSKYMTMTEVPNTDAKKYKIYPPDGSGDGTTPDTSNFYLLKDGSLIAREVCSYADYHKVTGSYKEPIGGLLYDINGMGGNNKAGKEVFLFVVDSGGRLIPYGSYLYYNLYKNETKKTCSTSSSDEYEGFACTGKIADNGWKAEY